MTGREPTPAANDLRWLIDRLAQAYDPAPAPFPTDPFEIVLWDNLAFLVNDERRSRAFEALRRSIGTDPEKLLRADEDQVQDLARMGYRAVLYPVTSLRVAMRAVEEALTHLRDHGTQRDLLGRMQSRAELYDLLGYTQWEARDRAYFQGGVSETCGER